MADEQPGEAARTMATTPTPANPDEMSANVELRIGNAVKLSATARATPLGLVAVGALVSAIILSVAPLVWSARRRPY